MSPPCSCAICGLPVTKGVEVLYHKGDRHEDSGYAYVHYKCVKKHENYMRCMGMVLDDDRKIEWSETKGGYIGG